MQNSRKFLVIIFLFVAFKAAAQNSEIIRSYINTYKSMAIAEMQRTGVPASIKLAQGIHETMAGTSQLVLKSNNHFGIKCKSNWTGQSVSHDDDARGECFRKYPSPEDSYRDHSDFLRNNQRYASLFALDPSDYEGWANGLKKAGYATNPKYPQVLIKLIEDYQLQNYTLIALGAKSSESDLVVKDQADSVYKGIGGFKSMGNVYADKPEIEKIVPQAALYPAGEFKINETRVVFIKQGASFLSIAQQYNIPLARLFEFNEISETETSNRDQLIFLQRKRKTGSIELYTVQPGETLHDIAQKQGIRLESLLELNWLKEYDRPAPGEQLNLKKKSSAMPKLALKGNYSLHSDSKTQSTNQQFK